MGKLYEFVQNKGTSILEIRQLIYFDEKWMFPGEYIYDQLKEN
jgi:hypothetical protein